MEVQGSSFETPNIHLKLKYFNFRPAGRSKYDLGVDDDKLHGRRSGDEVLLLPVTPGNVPRPWSVPAGEEAENCRGNRKGGRRRGSESSKRDLLQDLFYGGFSIQSELRTYIFYSWSNFMGGGVAMKAVGGIILVSNGEEERSLRSGGVRETMGGEETKL